MASLDVANEIVLKMIETKSILFECQSSGAATPEELAEINKRNVKMVCNSLKAIAHTAHDVANKKFDI